MLVKEKLLELFKTIGLSEKEAKIYLTLFELKAALPSSIARRSGVKRSHTYNILNQLVKKDLLNELRKNGHLVYELKNPKCFIEEEIKKFEGLQASLQELHVNLPKLLSLHRSIGERLSVSVFNGTLGLMKLRKLYKHFRGTKHHYKHEGSEIIVFGPKIAIISGREETSVLIQNKNIAETQKFLIQNHIAKKNHF